jgi:hypothetical protein
VATGKRWLGTFATAPGPVLIVDNELHAETIAHRIPKVADALGIGLEEYADAIRVQSLRGQLRDINGLGKLLLQFEAGQFRLIVVDAFYRCLPRGTDENSNGDVAALYNTIDQYADRLRCAIMLIHHSTKGNQAGKATTDIGAGAGSQARATDTHLVLRPHADEGAVVLEAAARSWPPVEPVVLRWSFPIWTLDERADPQAKPAKGRSGTAFDPDKPTKFQVNLEKVVTVLRDYGPQTKAGIRARASISGETANETVEALLDAGRIEACQVPKAGTHYPGFRLVKAEGVDSLSSPGLSTP